MKWKCLLIYEFMVLMLADDNLLLHIIFGHRLYTFVHNMHPFSVPKIVVKMLILIDNMQLLSHEKICSFFMLIVMHKITWFDDKISIQQIQMNSLFYYSINLQHWSRSKSFCKTLIESLFKQYNKTSQWGNSFTLLGNWNNWIFLKSC